MVITITLMTIIFKVSFKAEDTITGKKIALPDITKHTKSFFACLPPDCFRIIHHITKAKRVSFTLPIMIAPIIYSIVLIAEFKNNSIPYCKTIFSSSE